MKKKNEEKNGLQKMLHDLYCLKRELKNIHLFTKYYIHNNNKFATVFDAVLSY